MKPISELKLETIQLEDQVLLVKNGEIPENWYLDDANQIRESIIDDLDYWEGRLGYKSIIASTKPLEELPLLVIEDEIDSIVESEFKIKHLSNETYSKKALWKDGYATAKETYKFTEEDLIKAIDMARKRDVDGCIEFEDEEIIKSLTKKELWIEVEEKHFRTVKNKEGQLIDHQFTVEPKITEGKIKAVWK